MSYEFIDAPELPTSDYGLKVIAHPNGLQAGKILAIIENAAKREKTGVALVEGARRASR